MSKTQKSDIGSYDWSIKNLGAISTKEKLSLIRFSLKPALINFFKSRFHLGRTFEVDFDKIITPDSTAVKSAIRDNEDVRLTLKPHPVCTVNFREMKLLVVNDPIDGILPYYDLAIVARTTSAAIDVYYTGINMIVFLGNRELNLSPF